MGAPAPRLPATIEEFCTIYGIEGRHLAKFMVEAGFWDRVASDVSGFKERVRDVRQAALKNALDSKRKDQLDWIRTYGQMIGVDILREGKAMAASEDEGTRVLKLKMKG